MELRYRQADDRGRVGEPLGLRRGAGERHFIHDHLCADIAFEQFVQAQRSAIHQHLPLSGHHGSQLDLFVGRVGPEGAQHRRRQVIHKYVAGSLDGHFALVQQQCVAVFEDSHLSDRHLCQGAERRCLFAPGHWCAKTENGGHGKHRS